MSDKKKRQHYVWRYYLKPWSHKEQIYAFSLISKETIHPGLMGVAQEKYFYKLIDLEENEIKFINSFITEAPPALKELNNLYLSLFTSVYELKKKVLANPQINKAKADELINKLDVNLMEDAHCHIESMGNKLVSVKSFSDFTAIVSSDDIFDAIMFLCFQYFRTSNLRKKSIANAKTEPNRILTEKTWNIISFVLAGSVARNISVDMRTRYKFITNDTSIAFLTSDQPVFNLLADDVDESGATKDLEFYYPLTPNIAITVHRRHEDQIEQCLHVIADERLVNSLNHHMCMNAERWVFAQSQEELATLEANKTVDLQ
jgi:phosphoribosylformylglycinamidine (FGAM) synthase PurS component